MLSHTDNIDSADYIMMLITFIVYGERSPFHRVSYSTYFVTYSYSNIIVLSCSHGRDLVVIILALVSLIFCQIFRYCKYSHLLPPSLLFKSPLPPLPLPCFLTFIPPCFHAFLPPLLPQTFMPSQAASRTRLKWRSDSDMSKSSGKLQWPCLTFTPSAVVYT
jgi:hypothetical protein